jgi:hypothetical protein
MTQPPPREPSQSRRDLASELVQSIIKDKTDQRERGEARVVGQQARRERMRRVLIFGLLPAFLVLLGWNLTRGAAPPEVFTPAEVDASTRFKIYLAAQALRVYRDSAGSWPTTLDHVGFGDEGLAYSVTDTSYEIQTTIGGQPFVYHSGDNLEFFRDAPQDLIR